MYIIVYIFWDINLYVCLYNRFVVIFNIVFILVFGDDIFFIIFVLFLKFGIESFVIIVRM